MNPALIAALITQFAIPELQRWLAARHATGQPLTDADVFAKLQMDSDQAIATGEAWLVGHPEDPPSGI